MAWPRVGHGVDDGAQFIRQRDWTESLFGSGPVEAALHVAASDIDNVGEPRCGRDMMLLKGRRDDSIHVNRQTREVAGCLQLENRMYEWRSTNAMWCVVRGVYDGIVDRMGKTRKMGEGQDEAGGLGVYM